MSPLVEEQLARARRNFKGRIHLLRDFGDSALVVAWPEGWWRADEAQSGDWIRMVEPFLLLLDPAREHGRPH